MSRSVLVGLLAGLFGMTACAVVEEPSGDPRNADEGPNAGMFRDFMDGKFDTAGRPLNAIVVDVDEPDCRQCIVELPANARGTGLTANLSMRVHAVRSPGRIAYVRVFDANNNEKAHRELTTQNLRDMNRWIDLPIGIDGGTRVVIDVVVGARVEVAYAEILPTQLGLVTGPGSGVLGPTDKLIIEIPRNERLDVLTANSVSVKEDLESLISMGKATRTTTELRTVYEVAIDDLLPNRADIVNLRAHHDGDATRMQIRATAPDCTYEGEPNGVPVLVTGFQPFPANAGHENVSEVAVTALDTSSLRGARVMKLLLPVEYDRAAAMVEDVIARCQPTHVLSFGQGGDAIALERTAYNLQDTGELAGGVPDNRGIIRSATPIVEDGPAQWDTRLPLGEIRGALAMIGEAAHYSTDPGRYICNNVMYTNLASDLPGRTGFIHLPYTTNFSDRARWGRIVAAAVQSTVDAD